MLKTSAEAIVIEILLNNELRGNPERKLSGRPLAFRTLCNTHIAIGAAVYRIGWFRFVNPRKSKLQALQPWKLCCVGFIFCLNVSITEALAIPSLHKDKLSP